jgi:hypothetical protein
MIPAYRTEGGDPESTASSMISPTLGASTYLRSKECDSIATYLKFLVRAPLRGQFRGRLRDTLLIRSLS